MGFLAIFAEDRVLECLLTEILPHHHPQSFNQAGSEHCTSEASAFSAGVKVERPNDKERPMDNGSTVSEAHAGGNAEGNGEVSHDPPKEA